MEAELLNAEVYDFSLHDIINFIHFAINTREINKLFLILDSHFCV